MRTIAIADGCVAPVARRSDSARWRSGTPKAVGADASLQATVYKGEHETKLVLDARNLPPPARVTADAKFFVVWARKDSNATWQRAGNVVYDDGARTGVFKGSFPETGFDLEVTAEKEESAASPSPDIVFAQHVGAS